MSALDDQLPEWHHRERHAIRVGTPADVTLTALDDLTWREVPLFAMLMRIRSLGRGSGAGDHRILEDFRNGGFRELIRNGHEIVYAAVARPWSRSGGRRPVETAAGFREFAEPGWAKMAIDFRVEDGVLSTETRVWLTDARSRRAFGRYWLLIRPFSGMIRRTWLRATARRADVIHRL
jgi:hypothetical protein